MDHRNLIVDNVHIYCAHRLYMKPSIKKSPSDYRHGALREALISAAYLALAAKKEQKLSVRDLARQAGVTPNAFYRHFASKEAILAALAAEGFDKLSVRFDAVKVSDPAQRVCAMVDAYIKFAQQHPAQYRLMFGPTKAALKKEDETLHQAAAGCFGRVVAATANAGGGDPRNPQTLRRALELWALVHGWSMLRLDGLMDFLPADAIQSPSLAALSLTESWARAR